jgi:hypothetical protein
LINYFFCPPDFVKTFVQSFGLPATSASLFVQALKAAGHLPLADWVIVVMDHIACAPRTDRALFKGNRRLL